MNYRKLTSSEIALLQSQGCKAKEWADIMVSDPFVVSNINNVRFSGKVYLGHDVVLENIQNMGCTGSTTFANALEVGVLKEDGGTEVLIHDGLTAMEAAFQVQESRHNPLIVAQMHDAAKAYAERICSDGSIIESGAMVKDVHQLTDVHICSFAHIEGATRLVDVTINSSAEAVSGVGDGVILEHVIVDTGSHIGDYAQLDNCFVGQGCHIGRMYSATQSLFFSNCHFENGEACAYFAGPYSVSHHKATLMIACQTSFFNAGSGSNQSNHSYKMGPNKYGQLLRGAKLGSSSYVYWPMQIGVFSTVIGHHVGHQDLRDLPFSLITSTSEGKTMIVPAQAFRSVGTRRDAQKWPKRDKRAESGRKDIINFSLLNPYNVGYILKGLQVLKSMKAEGLTEYKGCVILEKHIDRGIQLYQMAIDMYLGQWAEKGIMPSASESAQDTWMDYGGMLVPRETALRMLTDGNGFADMATLVDEWEAQWVCAHFDITDRAMLIAKGKEAETKWNAMLDADGEVDVKACDIEMI